MRVEERRRFGTLAQHLEVLVDCVSVDNSNQEVVLLVLVVGGDGPPGGRVRGGNAVVRTVT